MDFWNGLAAATASAAAALAGCGSSRSNLTRTWNEEPLPGRQPWLWRSVSPWPSWLRPIIIMIWRQEPVTTTVTCHGSCSRRARRFQAQAICWQMSHEDCLKLSLEESLAAHWRSLRQEHGSWPPIPWPPGRGRRRASLCPVTVADNCQDHGSSESIWTRNLWRMLCNNPRVLITPWQHNTSVSVM